MLHNCALDADCFRPFAASLLNDHYNRTGDGVKQSEHLVKAVHPSIHTSYTPSTMSTDSAAASSAPQDGQAGASTSGLPAAAKAAAELAVKTAIAESVPEDGEINEDESSAAEPGAKDGANGAAADKDGDASAAGGIRTVFSDPANFNVVHPLYSKW